jgi:hypothetical protein
MKNYSLIPVLLLISNISYAIGPEDTEYFGRTKNGKKITLKFELAEDGNSWHYGTNKNEMYRFCIPFHRGTYVFECSTKKGAPPNLIYERGEDKGTEYEKAVKIAEDKFSSYGGYYVCKIGCNKQTADILIAIDHDGP